MTVSLRLPCCMTDLPACVLNGATNGSRSPRRVHVCGVQAVGGDCTAVWEHKSGVARDMGASKSQRSWPPTWVLQFEGPVENVEVEERLPDDSPGTLVVGEHRLPAEIVDRSLYGWCVSRPRARPAPGRSCADRRGRPRPDRRDRTRSIRRATNCLSASASTRCSRRASAS